LDWEEQPGLFTVRYIYLKVFPVLMIGSSPSSNNLIVFFEGDEIDRLEYGIKDGIFVNNKYPIKYGVLEAFINDELSRNRQELVTFDAKKNERGYYTYMLISINSNAYRELKESGCVQDHHGNRHMKLQDANRLDYFSKSYYSSLKLQRRGL